MKFYVRRDEDQPWKDRTLGEMYANTEKLGQTLEDQDRDLEHGGEKVYGQTCIPSGTYRIQLGWSAHFNKIMPHIVDVPGFTGILVHGGNGPSDTFGCVLLGRTRRADGSICDCAGPNERLKRLLEMAEEQGDISTIEVSKWNG